MWLPQGRYLLHCCSQGGQSPLQHCRQQQQMIKQDKFIHYTLILNRTDALKYHRIDSKNRICNVHQLHKLLLLFELLGLLQFKNIFLSTNVKKKACCLPYWKASWSAHGPLSRLYFWQLIKFQMAWFILV